MTTSMGAGPSDQPITYVAFGNKVEIDLISENGERERLVFDIVSDEHADFARGFLGAGTLLARTLLGKPLGAVLPYAQEDIVEVHVLTITPGGRVADPEIAAARRATTERAVQRSQDMDAIRLALTVDVKWGDYDPEGIAPPDE